MAIIQDTTAPRHAALEARLVALNCELLQDETEGSDRYYVLDKNAGKLVSVGATIEGTYAWCAQEEIASRASSWRSRGKTLSRIAIARLRNRLETMERRKD